MSNGPKLLWKKIEVEFYLKKYQDEVAMRLHDCFSENVNINSSAKVSKVVIQVKAAALSTISSAKSKPYLKSYCNASLTALNKTIKYFFRIWVENVNLLLTIKMQSKNSVRHSVDQSLKTQHVKDTLNNNII